jgi:pyruvate dehydrogenase E1 component alpha subunit
VASNAVRAAGYAMPGERVDENDAQQMFPVIGAAIARARAGEGPSLIEVKVDRLYGHFQGDPESYRPKGEVKALKANDPIARLEKQLAEAGVLDDAAKAAAKADAKRQVAEAIQFARDSAYPAAEEAVMHVFA